jgi:hypothetical protein
MSEATSRSSAFGSMLRAFLAVFAFVFAPSIAVEALVRAFGDEAMRTSMPAKMGGVAFAALVLFSLARALPPGPAFAPMRPRSVVARYGAFFVAWALFAVGCIMYYILSSGQHPFGEWIERDSNIVRDRPNTSGLSWY